VNTGWQGGPYGLGKRISIPYTRAMITAALSGELAKQDFKTEPVFNLQVPQSCPDIPAEILDPRGQWKNPDDYDVAAQKLASLFKENFKLHGSDI
jgi:phosphoenolpyruvate carboxykinase (ATP)